MDIEILNAILNTGGNGLMIYFFIRLEQRMAERDKQIWALLDWLIKQPRINSSEMPPIPKDALR
jgi:hypothetical protein